jgi:dipeptidase E
MRKLFLTSAGLPKETRSIFLEFFGKDPKESKVAFIPTASDPEENKSYLERDKKVLEEIGFEIKEVDLKNENEKSLLEKMSDCDIIFVEGGNTYYLLDQVRKSGFDKVIIKLLDQGKIYVGVSAGSYIVCPTIEQAGWKHTDPDRNIPGLKDLTAMNLVPFLISAHYNRKKYREAVENGVGTTKYPVVVLYDTQAIKVEGDKYQVVGNGKREFFNGFHPVK